MKLKIPPVQHTQHPPQYIDTMQEKLDFIENQLIAGKRRFFPVLPPDADVSHSEIYTQADLGKRPLIAAWQRTKPTEVFEKNKYIKSNIGIALDPTDFVVDIDWYKGVGRESYQRLCEDFGCDIINQARVVVRTGGGGIHAWFKKPANVEIAKKHKAYPGIEFLTYRSFVVSPYSKHTSGNFYEFDDPFMSLDDAEPAPVNAEGVALYDIVRKQSRSLTLTGKSAGLTDSEVNIAAVIEYLEERAEPAVEGTRNNTLYTVACHCFSLGVTEETATALILEYYNPLCLPPLDEEEVINTVANASRFMDQAEKGARSIESIYSDETELQIMEPDPNEWRSFLRTNRKTGMPLTNCYFNTLMVFSECPDFKGKIVYDSFEQEIKYTEPMPWNPHEKISDNGVAFGDDEIVRTRAYLNVQVGIDSAGTTTHDALREVALANTINPVKSYIESQTWDGVPRVGTWLTDYCGVKDSQYIRAVGRKLLAAMVKRVYEPGCQWDHMVILEGAEGLRKSSLCRALGAPWTSGSHLNPLDKDAFIQIRGRWVVEVPEYDKYSKFESGHLKAFITEPIDRYRDPFGRTARDRPRTSVFIASTNKKTYLYEETGSRRYWPIVCGDIDIEGVKNVRGQLIAEAFHIYKTNPEPLFMETEELKTRAKAEQLKRLVGDSWEEVIAAWLDSPAPEEEPIQVATTVDIWSGAFLKAPADLDKRNRNRISDVMSNLGWKTRRIRRNGIVVLAFERPE